HRKVCGLEKVGARRERLAFLETLSERHRVDAIDGFFRLGRSERGLEVGIELVQPAEIDAVLICERAGQRGTREHAAVDEKLAEETAGAALLVEPLLELIRRQQLLVDEQRAELPPRECNRSLHTPLIGTKALVTQALSAGDHTDRLPEDFEVVAEESPASECPAQLDVV